MSHFLVQHKQAGKRYHRVDQEELKQLRSDAIQLDKSPLYMIEFDEGDRYYLIDQIDFDVLNHYMNDYK